MKGVRMVCFVLLYSINTLAQYNINQNKVWAFGRHAGLDFTSGSPVAFTSSFNNVEGGASVSDASGNLLFYTDGKQVWNKTGALMPSGSSIVPYTTFSTTQSSVIAPVLNNPNQYYVFSLGYYPVTVSPCILTYSIVDMTLAGGLGDVVPSAMGVYMDSVLAEKMIAVKGDNCNMWLIVHKYSSTNFLSYEITTAGISSTPVVSATGTFSTYLQGAIKVSHDRQKIVNTNSWQFPGSMCGVELFDFNASTGVVSNCKVLNTYVNCYGAEFSPDNSKLYISNATSTRKLLQYDISLSTLPLIIASEFTVASGLYGSLKIAPDDNIYMSSIGSTFVDRVSSPNLAGGACNYIPNAVSLAPDTCSISLPNLFWSVSSSSTSPITGITTLCQGTTTTFSNAMAGGVWSSANTVVATITNAGVVTGVGSGTSVISYTTGCGATTATVTVLPAPQAITGTTTICAGNTSAFSSSPAGGTWSSSNISAATVEPTGSGSGTVSGIAPGTTVITYILAGGCTSTATVTVNAAPSAISGATQVCMGATISLSNTVSGGTWSSGNTGTATVSNAGAVTGVAAGDAIISYTTGSGCTKTVTVTVLPAPQAITGVTTICAGNASTLSSLPTGGTWSSSNTNAATVVAGNGVVTGIAPGTTVITYVLAGGCAATVSVTVNAAPSAISGAPQVCMGATTNLSNTVNGGTWSSANTSIATVSNTGAVTGVATGTAAISYTTGAGCTKTVTVTVNPTPGVISGITVVCGGATTALNNAVGGGMWSSSATGVATVSNTGIVTGISTGKTVISYTNNCGQATVTVTVTSPPAAIAGTTSLCAGATTTLSNSAAGGTWSSGTTSVAEVNGGGVVTGVSAGTAVIRYQNICGIATTTVTVSPGAQPITGSVSLCVGATIVLSNSNTGGTWSSSSGGATVSGAGIVTGVSAGIATISYTVVSGICGAVTATKTITVTAPPTAGVITGDTALCAGAILFLSDTVAGGVWSSASVAIATVSAGGTVSGVLAGAATISYTITNSCGTATSVKNITVHALPLTGVISGTSPVCKGAVITLSETVTGGTWSSSNATVATVSATGEVRAISAGATTISYTVTSPAGCSSIATYTVTVDNEAAFVINSTVTQPQCYGDKGGISIAISGGTPPFDYLWSTGNTGTTIADLLPGAYTLSVKEQATQCEKNDSFRIMMPDTLTATTTVTNDKCDAGQGGISVAAAGGTTPYSYAWSNNATSKDIVGLHAAIYSVIVTDAHNCRQYTAATITDTCSKLAIHDVITPNGDGVNDMWVIEGLSLYPNNSVRIFDKWGDAVYEQTNYRNDWNGNGKSGALPDGTYYYLVTLDATATRSEQILTGTVLIKR